MTHPGLFCYYHLTLPGSISLLVDDLCPTRCELCESRDLFGMLTALSLASKQCLATGGAVQNRGVNECALKCARICLFTWVRHSEMTNVMKEGVRSTGPCAGGTVRAQAQLGSAGCSRQHGHASLPSLPWFSWEARGEAG